MDGMTQSSSEAGRKARLISAAGVVIILLAAGAALLPAADAVPGSTVVGILLLTAGIVELLAGTLRDRVRGFAVAAGVVTSLAGLLFVIYPAAHFSPVITLVTGWLILRSIILAVGSSRSVGPVRTWMLISAGTDFLLAVLLLAGMSAATVIVSTFGPTPELVASFAWILALSFVVTGVLLLQVASCERDAAPDDGA